MGQERIRTNQEGKPKGWQRVADKESTQRAIEMDREERNIENQGVIDVDDPVLVEVEVQKIINLKGEEEADMGRRNKDNQMRIGIDDMEMLNLKGVEESYTM